VGTIKLIKSTRISDGILRLYFVAGENALKKLNEEAAILHNLTNGRKQIHTHVANVCSFHVPTLIGWGVTQQEIPKTAERFFEGYKKLNIKAAKQFLTILDLQMKVQKSHSTCKPILFTLLPLSCQVFMLSDESKLCVFRTDEANPTAFISNIPTLAPGHFFHPITFSSNSRNLLRFG